ncbi:MAG: recombinase RecA [Elusimicrobia bacterium RIFOXYD2_FULL_34_15]|nr:MAG: recombinase RecA [Elusimicrobia bacterium RIFOXYD2_FULL_34_15]
MSKAEKSDKEKALDLALSQIEKEYGKGAIMRLGESPHQKVEFIPTGIIGLDVAIGVGGIPKGRIIELFGPESSGKSTLCLQIISSSQKLGGTCAYVDAEHAMDPVYATKLGVDIDKLLISQPDSGEQALEITEKLVRSNAIDLIIVDSVAALTPRAEIEGEMGDSHMGLQARLMSQALRKLTAIVSKSKTSIIFINQLRQKIGVMFGNPETTTGGLALKFYASIRLDIRRVTTIKEGDIAIGTRVRVKVVKNKVAPPFKQAEFEMTFGSGISPEGSIIETGVEYGIVEKSGSWFVYKNDRLGQGMDNSKVFLKENPKVAEEIKKAIFEKASGIPHVEEKEKVKEKK